MTGYEMLAGRRPFTATNPAALLRAHVDTEPPRPSGLAEPLWQVIRDCLAKDPKQRPSADRIAERLTALHGRVGALPADAPAPVPPKPDRLPRSPQPAPAGTGIVGLVTGDPSVPTPVPGDHEAHQDDQPDELITAVATRPAPPAPEPDPVRRPRWPWIAALSVLALLGAAGGLWVGRPLPPPPPRYSPSVAPSAWQFYYLPVTATSPKAGTVRLDFADVSNMLGFDSYVVFLDENPFSHVQAAQAPPYLLADVDQRIKHCYRVAALVKTNQPTPLAPKPSCLVADGRTATWPSSTG